MVTCARGTLILGLTSRVWSYKSDTLSPRTRPAGPQNAFLRGMWLSNAGWCRVLWWVWTQTLFRTCSSSCISQAARALDTGFSFWIRCFFCYHHYLLLGSPYQECGHKRRVAPRHEGVCWMQAVFERWPFWKGKNKHKPNNNKNQILPRRYPFFSPGVLRLLTAMDQEWHPACFVCSSCRGGFDGDDGKFFVRDGKPLCKNCSLNDAPRCAACSKPCTDNFLKAKALGDSAWHSECFVCGTCKKVIDGSFIVRDMKPFCSATCGDHHTNKAVKAAQGKLLN